MARHIKSESRNLPSRRLLVALGVYGFLLLPAGAWCDDSFRDLPLQKAPSPQDLTKLISNPALRQIVEQAQQRLREGSGAVPEGSPEEKRTPFPKSNSPLSEEFIQEMAKTFGPDRKTGSPATPGERPNREPASPREVPNEERSGTTSQSGRPVGRNESRPSPERFPSFPPAGERTNGNRDSSQPEERPSNGGDPQTEPREGAVSNPPGRPESPDPAPWRPRPRSQSETSTANSPLDNFRMPEAKWPDSNRVDRSAANSPASSKRQFDEAINRIVMDTARRLADQEAETGRIESAFSQGSFLTPLVKRARESLAQRNGWSARESSWMRRQSRRIRAMDLEERLNWKPPMASAPDPAGWSLQLKLLAAPVVFGAVVLLLIPVWVRLRPKLAAYLHAAATLASLRAIKIDSPSDLVLAVDRYLLSQFGLSAAWWHCRTVEKKLLEVRPDLRAEISDLASAYELSRYGPDASVIDAVRLELSAATLRRLAAGPAESEPALSIGPA